MSAMSEQILCPNCHHDIGQHEWIPVLNTWACGYLLRLPCPCNNSPADIARALLAERDAKLAAVRKVRDHWAAAEYASLREQHIIDTIVDDFTDALGGAR